MALFYNGLLAGNMVILGGDKKSLSERVSM